MRQHHFMAFGALLASLVAPTLGAAQSAEDASEHAFGDIVEVTPAIQLVIGREANFPKGQIDIANALLYKSGAALVVVDTGGTAKFRDSLEAAALRLAPFDEVILISTHGHADHVGNNAWIDTLGVPATHYISAHDLPVMRDQVGYFTGTLGRITARNIVDLFGGLDTEAKNLKVIETLPLEAITIGGTAWDGWSLLAGDVLMLRTSGHTGGHVAIFLKESKLLHLGDETTSWYQAFSDGTPAGPAGNLLTLQRAANAVKSGAVDVVTDGHSFAVRRGEEAIAFLDRLIDGAIAFDAAVSRILNENADGISVPDLVAEVVASPELAGVPGGPENPYNFLQMANKLREMGIVRPVNPTAAVAFPN